MIDEEPTGEYQMIEELTAYLDGELDEMSIQRVETRLSSDPEYALEMQRLQQAWDILDRLPQTEPDQAFVKTTMEMVVQEAKRDPKAGFSWLWSARIATVLASFSILFFLGFTFFRLVQNQPDQFLIEHLSTVENHERYSAVNNDLDFLVAMNERGFFSSNDIGSLDMELGMISAGQEGAGSDQRVVALYSKDPRSRVAWIEALDLAQKAKLKKRLEDFVAFDPDRQSALIKFGRSLNNHPDRDALVETLIGYYDWLKTVDPGPRSRMLDEPVEQRLDSIAKIRANQARVQFGATNDLSADDAEFVFSWFRGLIEANESLIRERFPTAVEEVRRERGQVPIPNRMLKALAARGKLNQLFDFLSDVDRPFVESIVTKDEDVDLLFALLTPASRRTLEDQTGDSRKELIIKWVKSVNESYFSVSREALVEFYESLSQKQRDELDQLPLKDHLVRLKELYFEQNRKGDERRPFDWRSILEMENPYSGR